MNTFARKNEGCLAMILPGYVKQAAKDLFQLSMAAESLY